MFLLEANKVCLTRRSAEPLTSGSRNIYLCRFRFSEDWEGVDRLAVFCGSGEERAVPLGPDDTCQIPHEVLASPGGSLYAGVYGTKNGQLVMPTIQAWLGQIQYGTHPADVSNPPTPGVYEQLLEETKSAKAIAESVRKDADAGKFQGEAGLGFPPGGLAGQALVKVSDADYDTRWIYPSGGGSIPDQLGNGLMIDPEGRLAVQTADKAQPDNTLPITSAAVAVSLGNIDALLSAL